MKQKRALYRHKGLTIAVISLQLVVILIVVHKTGIETTRKLFTTAGINHDIKIKVSVLEGISKRTCPVGYPLPDNLPVSRINNAVIINVFYTYLAWLLVLLCSQIFVSQLPDAIKNIIVSLLLCFKRHDPTVFISSSAANIKRAFICLQFL